MIEFQNTVLQSLSEKAQLELSKIMVKCERSDGETIILEGTISDSFYILLKGTAVVSRAPTKKEEIYFKEELQQSIFEFKKFEAGRLIGESGYFDQLDRTQSIFAEGDCLVAQIRYDDLNALLDTHPDCDHEITKTLGCQAVTRLRNSNLILVDDLRDKLSESYKKVFYNSFLLVVICAALGLYFMDNLLQQAYSISFTFKFFSSAIIIIFAPMLFFSVKHRPSLKQFGLTLVGAARSLKHAFFVSLALCLLAILVKYVLLKLGFHFVNDRVFSMARPNQVNYLTLKYWVFILLYTIMAFPQELLTRGFLQGSFDIVLKNKSPWLSIVLSNFIFMTVHVSLLGYFISFLVFMVGLIWGWMYSKQKTLVGVTLSHAIVGVFGLYFVGFT